MIFQILYSILFFACRRKLLVSLFLCAGIHSEPGIMIVIVVLFVQQFIFNKPNKISIAVHKPASH